MSQFWATLTGVVVGGALALAGQWAGQARAARAEHRREWMKFQRDTVAGAQEALADMWRCFVVANPNNAPDPAPELLDQIPDDEARALMKASVHRTRLKDTVLAEEIKVWMMDATEAIDERSVTPEKRKDLLERYRSLTVRLGASVRDLQDPSVKQPK